jgi:hypothetical protein
MIVKRFGTRSRRRLIFSIALIALFLLTLMANGCASQRSDSAGKINSVYIKRADFMNSLRGHFTGFSLEKDRSPDDNEIKELRKQTWKDITKSVVLKEYFRKYGIEVTQKEVLDTLLDNVPASIKKAPLFQTNGVFDRTKYVEELLSEKSTQLDWLKQYYYEYYVPIAKLKPELQRTGIISKTELENLNKILNSSADIDWIVFDPLTTNVQVTQSDIDNYYHSNLKKYEVKPSASFGWVLVPVSFSQDDIEIAKAKIDSIYYSMYQGKQYSVMVQRFSQSPSFSSGGALGFLKTEELPDIVIKSLEGLNSNDITRPVRVGNAWIIYQLLERTKNLVKLNELVINITPGDETRNNAKERAIHLRDLAGELGLETASAELNLKYRLSGTVAKDSLWLEDSEACTYLMDRAFTQKPGSLLEPVYSSKMRGWIMAEVIDVQPFNYKKIITVSDEISAAVLAEKQKSQATQDATDWVQEHTKGQVETARQSGREIIQSRNLNINSSVLSEPVRTSYVETISNYFKKKEPVPVFQGGKVLLPYVKNVYASNPPVFQPKEVRTYYFEYVNKEWFEKWLDSETQKARVAIWYSYP